DCPCAFTESRSAIGGRRSCSSISTSGSASLSTAWRSATAPAPVPCRSSAARCGSISPTAFRCLRPRKSTSNRSSTRCCGSSPAVFSDVPFNIASYALLTMMVAQVTGFEPGDFVHTFGDAHLYVNHLEQARLQLSRAPRGLPRMRLNPAVTDLFAFRYEDFVLEGYDPHPHIKAEVAVLPNGR